MSGSVGMDAARDAVAIIGMGGRFPGARNVDEFWLNLCNGVESVRRFTAEELAASGVDPRVLNDMDYVPAGAPLEDADLFDAGFFGMMPGEAELMDPQQRLFLECGWAALEDAGYDSLRFDGLIGVFGGIARNTYFIQHADAYRTLMDTGALYEAMLGSEKDFVATRVSYKLNLRGPAVTVQSACSTSGVAIHVACQSLLNGECDLALAGGARVLVPLTGGYRYVEGGIVSPDGRCRAFDAEAQGCVYGSGGAVIVLRRLEDAVAAHDHIVAVIRGSAINNDGSGKIGFTAPSVSGQAAAIGEALAMAGVNPETIGYVEAHGTGTRLGDPIEIAALTKAYRSSGSRLGSCAIGSVKTNIGHLDAGAGVTGVIKAALALQHRKIPPSLNFRRPNPQIDFAASPFYVNTELREWPAGDDTPRRAGVSSFGLGGTNVHIVLEEAPPVQTPADARLLPWQLLTLSAKTRASLEAMTGELSTHVQRHPELDLDDVSYTLQEGRREFPERRFVVSRELHDAAAVLEQRDPRRVISATAPDRAPPVVFMFPGGGAQYPNMARDLCVAVPSFRAELDHCFELLEPDLAAAVNAALFTDGADEADGAFERPSLALPALVAVEYALAKLWLSWGIRPSALIGHSQGEYTAACIAGVMSLRDALQIAALRGRLFERLPAGGMISVPLPEQAVTPLLVEGVSIAALNAPSNSVLSGATSAIEAMEAVLAGRGIETRRLHIAVAAHSPEVDPILGEFEDFLRQLRLERPALRYVSNVTGTWIRGDEATDPTYWSRHLRMPVRFADGLGSVLRDGPTVLLEVGPGQVLSTFARQHPARTGEHPVIPTLRHPKEQVSDAAFLLNSLGRLWLTGITPDWKAVHGGTGRRVRVPTYRFERQRHWLSSPQPAGRAVHTPGASAVTPPAQPTEARIPNVTTSAGAATAAPRKAGIVQRLKTILHDLSGVDVGRLDEHITFLELGFDSLFLTRANTAFQREFGVKTTFRQLFDEAPTLSALAEFIDARLPEDAPAAAEPQDAPAAAEPRAPEPSVAVLAGAPVPAVSEAAGFRNATASASRTEPPTSAPGMAEPAGSVEWVVAEQLRLMSQQLELLRRDGQGSRARVDHAAASPARRTNTPSSKRGSIGWPDGGSMANARGFGPFRPIKKAPRDFTRPQGEYVRRLIARYEERTRASKRHAETHRARMSDPRTVAGFRRQWKELVYPIVSARSRGSRIWDVDGNEYVDLVMGFGAHLLGHAPDFVKDALRAQLDSDLAVGPQSPLAGEVAQLLCELTGAERMTYCQSGSEAVLGALRVARTVTGKDRIALFAGSYHGRADCVVVRPVDANGTRRSVPQLPGIPQSMVEDTIVLDYGDFRSLDVIRRHADELAAVLVEPVQSRNPALQPADFVRALREVTKECGVALIFDEMITGFRLHPKGAQGWYGVEADLMTYGKAVGGATPMAVLAGKATYLDALDGGMWRFGDDSFPETGVTFLGGTFVRYPMCLAAARATLLHLKERGPSLQEALNDRTARLAAGLTDFFRQTGTRIRIEHCASLFMFSIDPEEEYSGLLFPLLRERGVHIYEDYPCFLSTAHTEGDVEKICEAVKGAVLELRAEGLLGGTDDPTPMAATGEQPSGAGAHKASDHKQVAVPLSSAQEEIAASVMFRDGSGSEFHLSNAVRLRGRLDVGHMRGALQALVERHDGLRARLDQTGKRQHIAAELQLDVPLVDLRDLPAHEREARLAALQGSEANTPFDVVRGPLIRATLARVQGDEHVLLITLHHLICDGWALGLLLRELAALYTAKCRGSDAALTPPARLEEYAARNAKSDDAEAEQYWREQFSDGLPVLELPADRDRPSVKTYRAARVDAGVDDSLVAQLQDVGRAHGCTLFTTLLAAFECFVHRLSGQDDFVIGVPASGRWNDVHQRLVARCVNLLPLRVRIDPDSRFCDHLRRVRGRVLDAMDHQQCRFGRILEVLKVHGDRRRPTMVSVVFNMESANGNLAFDGLQVQVMGNTRTRESFDLYFNVVDDAGALAIQCTYDPDLFDADTVRRRTEAFEQLLQAIVADPAQRIAAFPFLCEGDRRNGASRPAANGDNTGTVALEEFVPPRNSTEERIAGIWREVLAVDRVGVLDNFYELGGHSLLAASAAERIARELGYRPRPIEFWSQTLGQIAAACDGSAGRKASRSAGDILRHVLGAITSRVSG
jgi:acyl transferase domain-containing protein/glutamate-1-semialdehyde aminotransferase